MSPYLKMSPVLNSPVVCCTGCCSASCPLISARRPSFVTLTDCFCICSCCSLWSSSCLHHLLLFYPLQLHWLLSPSRPLFIQLCMELLPVRLPRYMSRHAKELLLELRYLRAVEVPRSPPSRSAGHSASLRLRLPKPRSNLPSKFGSFYLRPRRLTIPVRPPYGACHNFWVGVPRDPPSWYGAHHTLFPSLTPRPSLMNPSTNLLAGPLHFCQTRAPLVCQKQTLKRPTTDFLFYASVHASPILVHTFYFNLI